MPCIPRSPCRPRSPCGPFTTPRSTHPCASAGPIVESGLPEYTNKFKPTIYPSPPIAPVASVGNKAVVLTAPFITIDPTLTPPIVVPTGIPIVPESFIEIVASVPANEIVFWDTTNSLKNKRLNPAPVDPKFMLE